MGEGTSGQHFVHLRVRSAFSLCEGAIPVKKLAKLSRDLNQPAIAMTDNNNLFGGLEFSKYCSADGVQPIIGALVSFRESGSSSESTEDELVLLCQNEEGYKSLSKLVSSAHLDSPDTHKPQATLDLLETQNSGLIALWGGRGSFLFRCAAAPDAEARATARLSLFQKYFPQRLYLEIQRCGEAGEHKAESLARRLAVAHNLPLVATNDVYFGHESDHLAQDVLMCIGQGRYEIEDDRPRLSKEHYLKSSKAMAALFADLPEALEATLEIARRCAFRVWYRQPILPVYPLPEGVSAEAELRKQAHAGFEARFESVKQRLSAEDIEPARAAYLQRLDFELGVIEGMGFAGYFLIVSDFMIWTKNQGIPIGVRGSGATSIVAWCMYITQLDPIRFDLVFERFLNPERVSLPDFDIDFCQERRGEVIQYIRDKYGSACVAQIVTFGTLQPKAAIKDVGRVVGAPFPLVDRMSKLIGDSKSLDDAMRNERELQSMVETDDLARRCFDLAKGVEGLYRHASTHAAGVIIADKPIVEYVPLYKDPNSDIPVTQFHFKDAEAVGLVKFDFLGLRTLTIVSNAVSAVQVLHGRKIDIEDLPFDDQPVYDMLKVGDTTGVFQLESPGMKDLLRRMKPTEIDHLIALISLYRPGPMDSIPSYVARANGQETVDYDHPLTQPVLKDTFGIITYQEQVMQLARDLAGYSLGEADMLRRAMGKKIAAEMNQQWTRFREGSEKKSVPENVAKLIFDKCAKFAGYGFNKGHAAAYAQVSYQTAYLKHHYPLEFYAACMTVDSEDVARLQTYVREVRGKGFKVLPPTINASFADFRVESEGGKSNAIRYSLAALKGVGSGVVKLVVAERERGGLFVSVEDVFMRCVDLKVPHSIWERFVDAGAFDALYADRTGLRTEIKRMMRIVEEVAERAKSNQVGMFESETTTPKILAPAVLTGSSTATLDNEKSVFGFYFAGHPVSQLYPFVKRDRFTPVSRVAQPGSSRTSVYEVLCILDSVQMKRSAKTGNRYAFVQISDESGSVELLAFSEVLESNQNLLKAGARVLAKCKVESNEGRMQFELLGLSEITRSLSDVKKLFLSSLHEGHSESWIAGVQKIVGKSKRGDVELMLELTLNDNRQVTIRLPQKIGFNADNVDQFIELSGTKRVEAS